MHPVVILISAAAIVFGPRLWANYILTQQYRKDEDISITAGELARELLDRHRLGRVKVESTDVDDHYDHCRPRGRACSLVSVLNFWPWPGRRPAAPAPRPG